MKKHKNLFKSLIFITIFISLWLFVFSILWTPDNSISLFYKEKRNSIDVVYVGSSNVYAHFNSVLAYNEYGFTTGLMSSDSQTFAAIEYLIKEAKKTQRPYIYIVDIACLPVDLEYFNEGDIRKVTDEIKFSKNKLDAINTLLKYSAIDKSSYPSFYFSFLTYHSSWEYLSPYNFKNNDLFKGHLFTSNTLIATEQVQYIWKEDLYLKLPNKSEEVLKSLLNYIKQENINILFVVPPKSYSDEANAYLNSGMEIIESYGYQVMNFNDYVDEINLDFSRDFYNSGHLNVNGATKFTEYFAKYLQKTYNLSDHRKDNLYKSWNEEYIRYKNQYYSLTGDDYDDLLLDIKDAQ